MRARDREHCDRRQRANKAQIKWPFCDTLPNDPMKGCEKRIARRGRMRVLRPNVPAASRHTARVIGDGWRNTHTGQQMMSATNTTGRRHPHDRDAAAHRRMPGDDQDPLSRCVDKGADRRMRHDAMRHCSQHGADRGLAPLRLCKQEDVYIAPSPPRTSARKKLSQSRAFNRMPETIYNRLSVPCLSGGIVRRDAAPIAAKDAAGKLARVSAT